MMAGILETKLYLPPWSAELISRPRLLEQIDPQRKLTLVSAPAGFGKTTLLAEWIATQPQNRVAWVSLDQSDNAPAVFWTYLISALQKIQPSLGAQSLSLLQSPQPPPIESVLMTLLNELTAIEADLVLILDDYHVLETQEIHREISWLLKHLPPQLHLILASRTDPPLSLARLRSRGELTELRVANLRFTPDEAAAFLHQVMGLKISAAAVSALEQRTEGWIAGLQLAALSLQGREDIPAFIAAFSGDDRYIVDYLIEEVLHQQPEHIRRFLLQTSILERLNSSLCDAVCDAVCESVLNTGYDFATQPNGCQRLLETLERSNLFLIPLDNKRQWYRYHHLFADVLQAHALMEWPDHIPKLHGRASQWYEQHNQFPEAIRHTLAAQDFARAADLIEQAWPTMRNRQQEATVLGWLKMLPDPLIRVRPVLSVIYGLVLLNTGPLEAVEARLQDAERQLEQTGSQATGPGSGISAGSNEAQHRSLLASIANARAFCAQVLGDFPGAIHFAQQALALLPTGDDNERGVTAAFLGLAYWTSGDVKAAYQSFAEGLMVFQKLGSIQIVISATLGLANMGMAQGWLRSTVQTCEQALQLSAQQPVPILQGTADLHLALSELRYEQGDLAAASQLLQKGEALREKGSVSGADYLWWLVKAQLTAAQGDLETALDQLGEAERLYRRSPIPNVRPVAALKVRWWLGQGKLAEALNWVREHGLSINDSPDYLREYEHLTLARVFITQHRQDSTEQGLAQVIELLNRLRVAAEAQDRTGSIIKILVVLTLAQEAQGDVSAAIASLESALMLSEPEGYVRIFAEHGPPMGKLLRETITRGITPSYSQRLLTALATWGQPQEKTSKVSIVPASQPLIDPLSQRELDVLRLLNTELSGPEIARELVVALSTVRTHTKRIYSKLNVSNRRAAVKRAQALDLI